MPAASIHGRWWLGFPLSPSFAAATHPISMGPIWLAFMTWLFYGGWAIFSKTHTKNVIYENEINHATFACEIITERWSVGI